MKYLQRIGTSLMLPVAVLPVAAILLGVGYWIDSYFPGNLASVILTQAGDSVLGNIAILFAVGVGIGMAKQRDGAAALSALVGWLVITTLLGTESVAGIQGVEEGDVNLAYDAIENVLVGIISGIVAGEMYNRFSHVQLPDALAFFSGRRLVPIMTALAMLVVSFPFYFIWPPVYDALVSFGKFMLDIDYIGAGLYGFFNRLLIPTGLHHALNQVFWFDLAGINDINNFLSGNGTKGVTGMYQAGFFPIMMFGLPGAALAMYHTAKTKRRKQTASLMMAAGFAAFFTGVTEPLEFSFMFLAPALYLVHAILAGLSMAIASFFSWTAGFGFSAGFIDLFLSFRNPMANKPWMLVVQGLVFFVIYYVIFRFLIVKLDLKTPGREDDDAVPAETAEEGESSTTDNKHAVMGGAIYEALGGKENISSINNCTTRLRLVVNDMDKVDQPKIKATGVPGVNVVGKHDIQVIVGTSVQFVADEIQRLYDEQQ